MLSIQDTVLFFLLLPPPIRLLQYTVHVIEIVALSTNNLILILPLVLIFFLTREFFPIFVFFIMANMCDISHIQKPPARVCDAIQKKMD